MFQPPIIGFDSFPRFPDPNTVQKEFNSRHVAPIAVDDPRPASTATTPTTQMDEHFATLRAEFARDRTLAESYIAIS
jgi:hypothetical protein